MRLGIAHHLGWAVAVTTTTGHTVVDRRRIDLIEPGLPVAPVEHDAEATMVARVRESALRATSASLNELAAALPEPIESLSLRSWPPDFPTEIAIQRRPPYNARADSVMYLQVLAEVADTLGWAVHLYDAKNVESQAARLLGAEAEKVLHGPRAELGPPWTKDHRMALAATIMAS
jgi:hypothetical protein